MNVISRHVVAALLAAFLFHAAPARAADYTLDAAHAAATFQISHLGFSKTHGSFTDIAGAFSFDTAKPEESTVEVTIQAMSIDTANEGRDKHLRSEDFFDVAKFPTLSFKSTAWKKTADKAFDVTGDFTLHGVSKSITVPVTLLGVGKGMKGEERAGFSAEFKIKRSDFGMDKMLGDSLIGDEVSIEVSFEGVKK